MISKKAYKMLKELRKSENSTALINNHYREDEDKTRAIIYELKKADCIWVDWADNRPYKVKVTSTGKFYKLEHPKLNRILEDAIVAIISSMITLAITKFFFVRI